MQEPSDEIPEGSGKSVSSFVSEVLLPVSGPHPHDGSLCELEDMQMLQILCSVVGIALINLIGPFASRDNLHAVQYQAEELLYIRASNHDLRYNKPALQIILVNVRLRHWQQVRRCFCYAIPLMRQQVVLRRPMTIIIV